MIKYSNEQSINGTNKQPEWTFYQSTDRSSEYTSKWINKHRHRGHMILKLKVSWNLFSTYGSDMRKKKLAEDFKTNFLSWRSLHFCCYSPDTNWRSIMFIFVALRQQQWRWIEWCLEGINQSIKVWFLVMSCKSFSTSQRWKNKPNGNDVWLQISWMSGDFFCTTTRGFVNGSTTWRKRGMLTHKWKIWAEKETEAGWRGNKCMEDGKMGRRRDTNERWKSYKSLLSDENAASLRRLLSQCLLKSTQRAFQQVSLIVFMLPMNFSGGNCKTPTTFSSSRKHNIFFQQQENTTWKTWMAWKTKQQWSKNMDVNKKIKHLKQQQHITKLLHYVRIISHYPLRFAQILLNCEIQ